MEEREQERADRIAFYTALHEAQQDAPNIEPTRQHFDGYPYASASDVMDVLGPILLKHGLVFELASTELVDEIEQQTARGGAQWRTDVSATFRLTHAPSGHSELYRVNGRRTNDKDKGVQHAITSAQKMLILKLLNSAEEKSEEGAGKGGAQATRASSAQRRPEQRAPGAPTPPQNGTPPNPESSPEERMEFAKDQVRAFMNRNHLKGYHLEALILVDKKIRAETVETMDVEDWEVVQMTANSYPSRFEDSMRILADEFPTAEERVSMLDDLVVKVKPTGPEKMLIEGAKVIAWNDAIEYWITELGKRDQGGSA